MSVQEVETLAHFFGPPDQRAAKALAKRSAFKSKLPEDIRDAAAESVIETSRSLLKSPIADILAEAWKTRRDIGRYRSAPPDQINEHPLLGHQIALKRTPKVAVLLNGAPTGLTVEFELKLALDMSGAHLRIQNGHIIGARVGEFAGKGSFSCGEVTLYERKSGAFRLPGALTLARPLRI